MLIRRPLIQNHSVLWNISADIVGMLTIQEIRAFRILEIAKWNFKSMKSKPFPFNDVNSMQLLPLIRIIEYWKKPRPFRKLAEISDRKGYGPVGPKDTKPAERKTQEL